MCIYMCLELWYSILDFHFIKHSYNNKKYRILILVVVVSVMVVAVMGVAVMVVIRSGT